MSYEPLHHKYRPQTFAGLVGQEAIATTLTNAIRTSKIAPAYLFTGPRGTGKTSSARILAKSLNCLKSEKPTEQPCGVCEVCKGIVNGSTLDVIEIDAASNTGVDNIRELIERAQFAPVQCRYKVYVIDECLTGDSLVQTTDGLIRIDDPNIKGKKVLSYNESSETWEFKKVVRWLDQGERQTLTIKTANHEIRCTGNHLIRTEQGWIAAKDIKEGAKILSPVNVDAEPSFTNLERMDVPGDLLEDTSSKVIHSEKNHKSFIQGLTKARLTTTYPWAQTQLEPGCQTLNSIQSHQWITSSEIVESVKVGGNERVYDIEVEDNHNFVANGLCLHNCHMLSQAAFNALLKTLEEPPDRVVFVLATTDPQRVLPTIISRCQRFDFRRIPLEAMVNHLRSIASKENINIAQEAVQLVAQVSQGGLRDAESLLDQLSLFSGQVTVERIWDLVGSCSEPDLIALLQAIAHNNPEAVLDRARTIMDRGREPLNVLQNLAGFYRDLLIAKTAPKRNDLVAVTPTTWKALCEVALLWEVPNILTGQQHLAKSEVQIKNTTQPRLWLEVTLLGLLPAANVAPLSTLGVQPLVSPSKVDTFTGNNAKQQQPITSDAQKQKTLAQTASAAENSQPIQRENPQPIPDENAHTSRPIPEPVAVEPSPPSVANSTSDAPQEQWQQILTNLQPMSTRELMRQMGHLIEFDGTVARIGMKSQMWCDKVKAYVPNIKAAFQETFKCEVEVRLELAKPDQTRTSRIKEPSREQSPLPQAIPTATATATATYPQLAEPAVNQITATSFAQTQVLTSQGGMTASSQPQPAVNNLELPTTDLPTVTTSIEGEEDEVAIAAQSLASFFKGEVVAPKDDPGFFQPIPIATNSLPLPSASEWDSADLDEDDIEF